MATEQEWNQAYEEAYKNSLEPGRYQYLYAGECLALEGWMDAPMDQRPDTLPDDYDVLYILDGFIADLDDEAGFSLWYEGGIDALCEDENGKLPHIHTWFYWARYHEDRDEMNDHFLSQCQAKGLPAPKWTEDM